jgi:hypothetical protein
MCSEEALPRILPPPSSTPTDFNKIEWQPISGRCGEGGGRDSDCHIRLQESANNDKKCDDGVHL